MILAGGSDKTEGEKWTASEAGKTKALASWQLWRHCRCPLVFFRSEITRSVQGVATRCFDSVADMGTIPTCNLKGPRLGKE